MTTMIDWDKVMDDTCLAINMMIDHAFKEIGLSLALHSIKAGNNIFSGRDTGFLAKASHQSGFDVAVEANFEISEGMKVGIRCYSEEEDLWGEPSRFEICGWGELFTLVKDEAGAFDTYKKGLSK